MTPEKGVLFLCVANSSRSQMAEGLARYLAAAQKAVYSAGSEPTELNPYAVRVMKEIGIDISGQRSKGIRDVPFDRVDLVVTLCADEVCPPLPPGIEHIHWPLPDPAAARGSDAEVLEAFRAVRDQLREYVSGMF